MRMGWVLLFFAFPTLGLAASVALELQPGKLEVRVQEVQDDQVRVSLSDGRWFWVGKSEFPDPSKVKPGFKTELEIDQEGLDRARLWPSPEEDTRAAKAIAEQMDKHPPSSRPSPKP